MKTALHLIPFAMISVLILAIPNLQDTPEILAPVLRSLAELPLVVGAVWLVLKLQERQLAQVKRIMSSVADRDAKTNAAHQKLIDELLETIRELTKQNPHQ